jgi:hypothetical protein
MRGAARLLAVITLPGVAPAVASSQLRAREVWTGLQAERRKLKAPGWHSLIEDGINLFHQTTRVYDSGCFELAAIGCRASIESGCYHFLTRREVSDAVWLIDHPKKLNGGIRRVDFPEIVDAMRVRRILSASQLASMKRIKEHGDLIAHFAARMDRVEEAFARKLRSGKVSPDEKAQGYERGLAPLEVLEDVRDAAVILLALDRAMFQIHVSANVGAT